MPAQFHGWLQHVIRVTCSGLIDWMIFFFFTEFQDGRLLSGDHILQIGDVSLRGMGSEQVAAVLRQSGTQVRLIVARPIEPTSPDYQVFIQRKQCPTPKVPKVNKEGFFFFGACFRNPFQSVRPSEKALSRVFEVTNDSRRFTILWSGPSWTFFFFTNRFDVSLRDAFGIGSTEYFRIH